MKFLLFLVVAIVVFLIYARRFRNPYKLIFIFGKKGAGKSTLMVKEMLAHQRAGWFVYTDMPDCLVPGVRIIDAADLATRVPPPGSVLFLEEVGITFDKRHWKEFGDGLRDFMKFLRKYQLRCYMNSQSYDVDSKIRDVVDSMVLMTSIADCIAVCRPIRKTVSLTEPSADKESRIADKLEFMPIWNWSFLWMPRYHKYFNSFSAPSRDPIHFEEITRELLELRYGSVPKNLQKAFASYEKEK